MHRFSGRGNVQVVKALLKDSHLATIPNPSTLIEQMNQLILKQETKMDSILASDKNVLTQGNRKAILLAYTHDLREIIELIHLKSKNVPFN